MNDVALLLVNANTDRAVYRIRCFNARMVLIAHDKVERRTPTPMDQSYQLIPSTRSATKGDNTASIDQRVR